ncbi:hypothetical protein [Rhodococcus sp. SG20037]|uniref:hypothetical protein n=1 Tax=Rhodococcus sp. SG20037 TaxID=3074148 RepID=UPI00287F4C19|nr:hypothetical protein [Rhodococcus sp. SG20037]WNF44409.1 hypothetical protein RHP72_13820 [Rhodococcus sp. SG20037]
MVGVKHNKAAAVDISLTGGGQLKGISAAGNGARKEPKYVALQVVIDNMNDLFGAEAFTESQVREFVQGLVQRLLVYPELVNQTKVNSKKQFMESQDFQAAVTEAVDNQEAHNTMADYFFSDGRPAISAVIIALADAFYEEAIDQKGLSPGPIRGTRPAHGRGLRNGFGTASVLHGDRGVSGRTCRPHPGSQPTPSIDFALLSSETLSQQGESVRHPRTNHPHRRTPQAYPVNGWFKIGKSAGTAPRIGAGTARD